VGPAGGPADSTGSQLDAGEPLAIDPLGAEEPPPGAGETQALPGGGLADADGATDWMSVGAGEGRSPTGSGPMKTNAARIPAATSVPASRPARIVIPVFIAAEGTSTDGRGRGRRATARLAVP